MINGRIFDAATMAQSGNHPAPAPKAYWKDGQITAAQAQAMVDVHGRSQQSEDSRPPN